MFTTVPLVGRGTWSWNAALTDLGERLVCRYSCEAAQVVELVDALDSKSSARKGLSVRVRPWAPTPRSSSSQQLGMW